MMSDTFTSCFHYKILLFFLKLIKYNAAFVLWGKIMNSLINQITYFFHLEFHKFITLFQNNHPSDQNSQKKKHKLNIFHLLLHTAVVSFGWLVGGFLCVCRVVFFYSICTAFQSAPSITALKMMYQLKGTTLPIAKIHCDKRQQMLSNTNQQLRTGQKKGSKIHLQRHRRTRDICMSTSVKPLNSTDVLPSI